MLHFVVQAGDVFFVCQPIQYAQVGRSHHDAWDIARAMDSFVKARG